MDNPSGKVALVTGASQGLGAGIARVFARAGFRVALMARSAAKLEAVAAQIAGNGGEAFPVPCDVMEETQVEAAFEQVMGHFERLDVVVNNAASLEGGPLASLPSAVWHHAVAVNLTGAFLCTRAAFRVMQPRGGGRIINVASIAAKRVRPESVPYAATKSGLWGLTQASALEGRELGIVCSCIFPGNIRTERRASPDSDFNREPMMSVDDVAEAVLFMATRPDYMNVLDLTVLPATQHYLGRG